MTQPKPPSERRRTEEGAVSDLDDMAREIGASIGRGLDIMRQALLADGTPPETPTERVLDARADRRTT